MLTYEQYRNYYKLPDTKDYYIEWLLYVGKTMGEALKSADEKYSIA